MGARLSHLACQSGQLSPQPPSVALLGMGRSLSVLRTDAGRCFQRSECSAVKWSECSAEWMLCGGQRPWDHRKKDIIFEFALVSKLVETNNHSTQVRIKYPLSKLRGGALATCLTYPRNNIFANICECSKHFVTICTFSIKIIWYLVKNRNSVFACLTFGFKGFSSFFSYSEISRNAYASKDVDRQICALLPVDIMVEVCLVVS